MFSHGARSLRARTPRWSQVLQPRAQTLVSRAFTSSLHALPVTSAIPSFSPLRRFNAQPPATVDLPSMDAIMATRVDFPYIFVSIRGNNIPGVTATFSAILQSSGASMIDVDQAVVHNKLCLYFLIKVDKENHSAFLSKMLWKAKELDFALDFEAVQDVESIVQARLDQGPKSYSITMLDDAIGFDVLAHTALACADSGFNIMKIERLSPMTSAGIQALELIVEAAANTHGLRQKLFHLQKQLHCDMALQSMKSRRAKRLVVMDMDSTLIQQEVIDELARLHGCYDEVAEVTERAMKGDMDFDTSLRQRVRLLKGAPAEILDKVYDVIELTPGAATFISILKKMGYRIAVLSGGFSYLTEKLAEELDLDYAFANHLEVIDGKLTGEVLGPIVNRERKRDLMLSLAQMERIKPDQLIAIGDGANDLDMLLAAGLGIAFCAKPLVREQANYTLNQKRLDKVLYMLGMRPKDVPEWEEAICSDLKNTKKPST